MENKNFGCWTSIILVIITPIISILLTFFNAWYCKVVYEVGIDDLLQLFDINLPHIGYWTFFFGCVVFSAIYSFFNVNKKKEISNELKTSINDKDFVSFAAEFINVILNPVLTKFFVLFILFIAHLIVF